VVTALAPWLSGAAGTALVAASSPRTAPLDGGWFERRLLERPASLDVIHDAQVGPIRATAPGPPDVEKLRQVGDHGSVGRVDEVLVGARVLLLPQLDA